MQKTLELDAEQEQLAGKLTSFLNRWAANDLLPQIEKVLTPVAHELTVGIQQKLRAMRSQAAGSTVHAAQPKGDLPARTRSFVEADAALHLATWDDGRLRHIDREDLASLAFESSDRLRAEFADRSTFLAYWRRLRAA